jgi:tetratricopeptide (TPR) repeat protein
MTASDEPHFSELSADIGPPPGSGAGILPAETAADKMSAPRTALVLLLAFLLASFPARNSDVWMHLATGRALVQGSYQLGSHPFAHTEGDQWVNHGWLYDLLSYGLYQAFGGEALVVFKGLLIVLLCGLLLHLTWQRTHRWMATLCIALALLAIDPYLVLRPACVSFLLLAATMWWLERPASGVRKQESRVTSQGSGVRTSVVSWLPVLLMFALWVNLDEWFFLGPLTVFLYWIGEVLQSRRQPGRTDFQSVLLLACAAGLVACLLNPHFVGAFTLPAALGPADAAELSEDPAGWVSSPFQADYFQGGLGLSLPGLAYYLLALLGLLSFVANAKGWRWSRFLVWSALFGLSAYRSAMVPFFAVAAAPIMALNFQEAAGRRRLRTGLQSVPLRYQRWGQALIVLVLAGLCLAAWPGWLQPFPLEPRRWAIETDPGLEQTALQIASWRAAGQINDEACGFNLSPAMANYLAWFAPREKSFLAGRPHLFPGRVQTDFLAVRRALTGEPPSTPAEEADTDWRAILRKARVTHLNVHDPSERKLIAVLRKLLSSPAEWQLVHVQGRAAVFAWRDAGSPHAAEAFAVPPLDLHELAFRPAADEKAPTSSAGREPQPRSWWDAFWKPRRPADAHRDQALIYRAHFEALGPAYRARHRQLWETSLAATVIGMGTPTDGFPRVLLANDLHLRLLRISQPLPKDPQQQPAPFQELAYRLMANFVRRRDDGPVGSLLLAVRASRRALHADPDDPVTHWQLGDSYRRLMRNTSERVASPNFPSLDTVRKVQAITALKHTVRLKPDLLPAHERLAALYQTMGYFDLALPHLQDQLKHSRAAGPRPGETEAQFAQRIQALEGKVEQLSKGVREAINLYETQAFQQDVFGRARIAQSIGLPGKALEILLSSQYEAFGREGALIELQLFLYTGRVKEVGQWMEPKQEEVLGSFNYRWLLAQSAAAVGDYAQADQELQRMAGTGVNVPDFNLKNAPPRAVLALFIGQAILDAARPLPSWQESRDTVVQRVDSLVANLRQQADLAALRGLLALEAGEVASAQRLFRDSLALWSAPSGSTELCRRFLQLISSRP